MADHQMLELFLNEIQAMKDDMQAMKDDFDHNFDHNPTGLKWFETI